MARSIVVAHASLAMTVLMAACGSDGADPGGASSSGATSRGGCEAICSTHAEVTFDESNASGQLEGALIEACRAADCARGTLERPDGGDRYTLRLVSVTDAGAGAYPIESAVSEPAPGVLRFRVRWTLGEGTGSGALAIEGETFSVTAQHADDSQQYFTRSFTATYVDAGQCGTSCKVFEAKP